MTKPDGTRGGDSKGIEIVANARTADIVVSGGGIEIRRMDKPITGTTAFGNVAYLLLDCSSSMEGSKFEQARRGGLDFANGAKEKGYEVGLITFDDDAHHLCEPQKDLMLLSRQLREMHTGSRTNMAAALKIALDKLAGKGGNRAVVVVTDGQPTAGGTNPIEAAIHAAKDLKENGIEIITIGTDDADTEFLKRIATRTDLSVMVHRDQLEGGISSATTMLPEGRH